MTNKKISIKFYSKGLTIQKIGFFAGSFDPFTWRHWGLISSALTTYDKIFIGIGTNPDKKTLFSDNERLEIIKNAINDFLQSQKYKYVLNAKNTIDDIVSTKKLSNDINCIQPILYNNQTVDTAIKLGANTLLRGERNSADKEYEYSIKKANEILLNIRNKHLSFDTINIYKKTYKHISSSTTKALVNLREYIAAEEYVFQSTHNAIMKKALQPLFEKTSNTFGITDKKTIDYEYNRLSTMYTSDRLYHNMSHIAAMVNYLNIYETYNGKLEEFDKNILTMSIFYHDFIQTNENSEQLSSLAASAYLKHQSANTTEKVTSLIMATNHTENLISSDLDKLIADLDLSILGTKHRYPTYARKIRQEYSQYSDSDFANGRCAILEKLLSKPNLYKTDFFKKMFQKTAEENLKSELNFWKSYSK